MKTKNELQTIIKSWWEWNREQSQVGEPQQFREQIGDWESGFRNWSKEGWVMGDEFQIVRVNSVRNALSIRLNSGNEFCDGLLDMRTGEWIEKEPLTNTTGSMVIRTARMDGE